MNLDGRIIEYLENGKFLCAYVLEDSGSRLRLLNQNGRELNLTRNRLVQTAAQKLASPKSREELMAILRESANHRAQLAANITLEEIWEVVSEKPDETFGIDFLASLFFGDTPSDDQCAAFLRAVIANRLYFKYRAGAIHVHSPEIVEQIKLQQEKEKEQETYIACNTTALRFIWEKGRTPENWPDSSPTLQLLGDYYLFGKEASGYELAHRLVKEVGLTGPHDVFQLLVKAGFWDKNENISLLRQEIPTIFSEAALAEIRDITLPSGDALTAAGRQDLRGLQVITIDGPDTRDFDDGLHIERQGDNYLVGIHITDVGLYIKQNTALFAEALKRGTSIYFPDMHLPMLPGVLSEDKLSLLRDQDRPALSFMVQLSPDAEVLKFDIIRSVISVKQQLTYQEADRLLPLNRELSALAGLSVMLRQRRVNRGALLLPVPELRISIGADDTIVIKKFAADTPSRILVAEFMILANTLGAQYVAEREVPGLFRCQPEPRQRLIDGFEDEIIKVIQQRKRLSPMSLLTTPKGHSCVGAPQYTTVTSPIRRLLDLVMQLQISHIVMGRGVLFSKKDMKHFGAVIQTTLEKANQAKYQRQRYWILKSLLSQKGERIPALVIESGHKRVHILLEEFLLDADLPPNPAFKVSSGDIVLVRLAKVDPLGNVLKLEW